MSVVGVPKSLELPDLFAPHLRRERAIDGQAPGPVAKAATAPAISQCNLNLFRDRPAAEGEMRQLFSLDGVII